MKIRKTSFALLLGLASLSSCSDKLEVRNPNQQTSESFGYTTDELEESVIAIYKRIRMEGTYARVGYTIDLVRGDDTWNSSQVWYLSFDDFNTAATDDIASWLWRDWYYVINACNFVLSRVDEDDSKLSETLKRIKGQAKFFRGLAYYNLALYFQKPVLVTDYNTYSDIETLYNQKNSSFDETLDFVEKEFQDAMSLLPSKSEGGEWAKGRANSGAAAGYLARVYMQRQKYSEALPILKDIINGNYGEYDLTSNYGDNFREGTEYENNVESLFEVQYLDYGSQGTDDEWTPVNTSSNATQAHAVESNQAPGDFGGWADISATPWLYNLFKAEKTKDGKLDPRLYWTLGTYETDWTSSYPEGGFGNVAYTKTVKADDMLRTNNTNGGIVIAKNTNLRTGLYSAVTTGLKCGINLRLLRFSDILLRAAECENEISGPTQQAIDWINRVRRRANLADLKLADFNKETLFEQIANVERPKEFGCEHGRGFDLLRWGFYYDSSRLEQMKEHNTFYMSNTANPVTAQTEGTKKSSFDTFVPGKEFLPIYQSYLDQCVGLEENSANGTGTSNKSWYDGKTIHPVAK